MSIPIIGQKEMPIVLAEELGRQILTIPGWLEPNDLPKPWQRVNSRAAFGDASRVYKHPTMGVAVVCTLAIERDRLPWYHISISRNGGGVPTWPDIMLVRSLFAPKDAVGYMVFPPENEYVHAPKGIPQGKIEVLHLFYAIGHRPTPDFRPDPLALEI